MHLLILFLSLWVTTASAAPVETADEFYALTDKLHRSLQSPIDSAKAKDIAASAEHLLLIAVDFRRNWNYGNAIYYAHLAQGRVDLFNGKIADADQELILAGTTPGSPQLATFGPNMTLALELLQKGERQPVLTYIFECQDLWDREFAKPLLQEWRSDVRSGYIPDFSGNLNN